VWGSSATGGRFERVQRTIKEKLFLLQQHDRTLANNNVQAFAKAVML